MRRRDEVVERSLACVLDRGGMRSAWLCEREKGYKLTVFYAGGSTSAC